MATTFSDATNWARSTVADEGGIADDDLSVTVETGHGALFPNPGVTGRPFDVILGKDDRCICTARTDDVLTITRTATASAHAEGATVELNLTAEMLEEIHDAINTLENTSGNAVINHLRLFKPSDTEYPATGYATRSTRNNHPTLLFVDAADTTAYFSDIMNPDYGPATDGLVVDIYFTCVATSGSVKWDVAIERIGVDVLDIDSDSFASAQTATTAVNGVSGEVAKSTITFTSKQVDSLAAGEPYRLSVMRDGDAGGDDAAGTAEVLFVVVRVTPEE